MLNIFIDIVDKMSCSNVSEFVIEQWVDKLNGDLLYAGAPNNVKVGQACHWQNMKSWYDNEF